MQGGGFGRFYVKDRIESPNDSCVLESRSFAKQNKYYFLFKACLMISVKVSPLFLHVTILSDQN